MANIVVVRHEIEHPALFGAAAALIAAERGAEVFSPAATFNLDRYPDAVQHVADEGALIPSGLIWVDRLTGRQARQLSDYDGSGPAVVPFHSAFLADPNAIAALIASGAEEIVVTLANDRFVDGTGRVIGWRDRHGRVLPKAPDPASPSGLVFAIAGPERQFLDTCPAPLAALVDAIEVAAPGSEIRYLDPRHLPKDPLEGIDGVLLPGGSEMSAVAGQVALAQAARLVGRPIVGLCLGMQSMSTAAARALPGWTDTDMAEAAPTAARHSFVRIETGEHRLGLKTATTAKGSRLAGLLGPETDIACNHRFRLAPALHEGLATVGVRIVALGGLPGQDIADAIEADEGFYMGMQGHPELGSRQGAPHPLIKAFVAATMKDARAKRA
ncbi:gamma-glutamyl-gamma-aminobutyrate hydrolase family protein [Rhizobium sp. TRM96647]|uniref:glutamine amidotransferase-related protein n=1 Tax=unclassified Rhizobium TaxID=2613769 RepID=UPI0021E84E4F|nr:MULTISPECIES: gamma-glutamyl-gamma-aminobutyrate hydrolase family protein [unclassified Rhizobium]MCV3738661.1 gamma-glutamyl-gamma-aminobutyrate hydrolase family protein [Rhizobium sp. TRM96647]MCV3760348.1 gamma-glutamyl-gamma-aminobutyrate hydrolase family protein [Rhizobium sp. TRM96650]